MGIRVAEKVAGLACRYSNHSGNAIQLHYNGTRLLLISKNTIVPSYSVKIFPEIPPSNDTTTKTPSTQTGQYDAEILIYTAAGAIAISLTMILVEVYWKRRRISS
ncbi:MAG: hypothetical protein ACFFEF_18540 [Candidatus Thorarchaeota archaeon]